MRRWKKNRVRNFGIFLAVDVFVNQVMCHEKNRNHSFNYLVTVRTHINLSK